MLSYMPILGGERDADGSIVERIIGWGDPTRGLQMVDLPPGISPIIVRRLRHREPDGTRVYVEVVKGYRTRDGIIVSSGNIPYHQEDRSAQIEEEYEIGRGYGDYKNVSPPFAPATDPVTELMDDPESPFVAQELPMSENRMGRLQDLYDTGKARLGYEKSSTLDRHAAELAQFHTAMRRRAAQEVGSRGSLSGGRSGGYGAYKMRVADRQRGMDAAARNLADWQEDYDARDAMLEREYSTGKTDEGARSYVIQGLEEAARLPNNRRLTTDFSRFL